MSQYLIPLITILMLLQSCTSKSDNESIQKWKEEIAVAEKDFNAMAQKEGLQKAFTFYAANDGVLNRNNKIIQGKEDISAWFVENDRPGATLTWSPAFIDVSKSGDLGYTYGEFTFTAPDSSGNMKTSAGIFHTVWKRQENGEWRFVWD